MDDGIQSATDDVVMAVGDPETSSDRDPPDADDRSPASSRRTWVVGLVVVAAVAATAIAAPWRGQAPADVAVNHDTALVTPPMLPNRPIAQRWATTMAADERVAALGVHDDLVVALARPDDLDDPVPPRVVAWDTTTGEVRWERRLQLPPLELTADLRTMMPTVHLVGRNGTTTLSTPPFVPLDDDTTRQVAMDPADGSIVWRDQRPGILRVHADRGVVTVTTARAPTDGLQTSEREPPAPPTTTVMDLRTGEVVFTAAGWPEPLGHHDWAFGFDSTEVAFELVDEVGDELGDVHTDTDLVLLDDTVVTVRGARLVGHDRVGQQTWSRDLPGGEPIPATEVLGFLWTLDASTAMVGTWRISDKEVGRLDELTLATVTADGLVEPLESSRVADIVASNGFNLVTLDGEALVLCADRVFSQPTGSADGEAARCPDHLAAVDLDGRVRATSSTSITPAPLSPWSGIPGLATTAGLVVVEDEQLVLREWSDFAAGWRLDLSRGFLRDHTVRVLAPSPRGLAISHRNANARLPDQVTWLS